MALKQSYLSKLDEYMANSKRITDEYQQIKDAGIYADSHKSEALHDCEIKQRAVNTQYNGELKQIIEIGKSQIQQMITSKTTNAEYQTMLSNALRIIELTGAELDSYELEATLAPFLDDEVARKGFESLMGKVTGEPWAISEYFPPNRLAKTLQFYDKVKTDIDRMMAANNSSLDFGGKEMHYLGMRDFIDSSFDDDLIYSVEHKAAWQQKELQNQWSKRQEEKEKFPAWHANN